MNARVRGWSLGVGLAAGAGILLTVAVRSSAAQDTDRTTLSGVYTAEQAERGKDVYGALCGSCHAAVTHTGATFRKNWSGRPLAALYTFMSTRMPKNEPASLPPETYADLLAYMLQMNKMPPGTAELSPDLAALQRVRIQLAAPTRRPRR